IPFFSSSSLRFFHGIQRLINNEEIGAIRGADVYSPASLEPNHVDLTWYGIHGIESLYAVMGPWLQVGDTFLSSGRRGSRRRLGRRKNWNFSRAPRRRNRLWGPGDRRK